MGGAAVSVRWRTLGTYHAQPFLRRRNDSGGTHRNPSLSPERCVRVRQRTDEDTRSRYKPVMIELLNRVHRVQPFPNASVRVAADPALRAPAATSLRLVEAPMRPWRESLSLIERHMPFKLRSLHVGDPVQTAGDVFRCLHLVHSGAIKTKVVAACGRQQVVGLHLRGDWVGFEGIATGYIACAGYAMDSSEIWTVCYATLLKTAERVPELAHVLYTTMGSQLARQNAWRITMATLPADARLADFLRCWVQALALRDLRCDSIRLHLTRAEIGNYLGMTLETVSRSFSHLVALGLVAFEGKGRRNIVISDINTLRAFVASRAYAPASPPRQWVQ